MGSLNQDFKYPNFFHSFIGFIFLLFLTLFVFTVTVVIGAFDTELYSPAVVSIADVNNF
jgi:hypothetical protein